jgi:hypothetical protein
MDHGRFRDGVHVGFLAGGKLSDKIGFTKSWFSVCSPILLFLYNTSILFFCGECLIFHNDRADMFRPAMFVSLPIQNRESHQVMTLVRLAVNLGFAAGPAGESS